MEIHTCTSSDSTWHGLRAQVLLRYVPNNATSMHVWACHIHISSLLQFWHYWIHNCLLNLLDSKQSDSGGCFD